MRMAAKFLYRSCLIACMTVLVSCNCSPPLRVTSIQKGDKRLTCKDIILEINEAEHYRTQAIDERGIGISEALLPACWASGFVNGAQAKKAADARIEYLGNIYDLLDCGRKADAPAPGPQSKPKLPPSLKKKAPEPKKEEPKKEKDEWDEEEPLANPRDVKTNDTSDEELKSLMHEHVAKDGTHYRHTHPYAGPHQHDK